MLIQPTHIFRAVFATIVWVFLTVVLASCAARDVTAPTHPLVLFGVDGADWKVIEWMWDEGRLPHIKALSERGVAVPLETFHHASPVIWTTVATGVMPEIHGITEFVVPTVKGDQPVSSTLRRVPALWNMLTAADKRVAVAGWWATWPAEEVNGVMISDRAVHGLEDSVWPPEFQAVYDEALGRLRDTEHGTEAITMLEADRIIASSAVEFAGEHYDLTMIYVRGVDISSHFNWKYFEPDNFPHLDQETLASKRELIAREYEFVDRTLGELLAAASPDTNIIMMSDHGFHAMEEEETKILINFDLVLQRLGFLTMNDDGVDLAQTQLYSYASPNRSLIKKIRFALAGRDPGGQVPADRRTKIRRQLTRELARVTYAGGATAFSVRDATQDEVGQGADFVVEVLEEGARKPLRYDGKNIRGAVRALTRLSGTHGRKTPGIFIAAGPDFESSPGPTDLRVIDTTPTILFALGLPVAENFAGRARTELFTEEFRATHPLQTIPTWGEPTDGENRESEVDEELVDQLKALGYIE